MQTDRWTRERRVSLRIALAALVALAVGILAACGSSTAPDAATLLEQTFGGAHKVRSGILELSMTIDPSGSSTLSGPISLTFGGPFESRGSGKLPKSDFSVRISAQGQTGSLGIVSTGTAGYVTLQGVGYQLPRATFQKLESSFAQVASSPGSGSGSGGTLAKLGIQPLRWLANPTVVGTEKVAGTDTTHIRSGINISAFLNDLDTFLRKASTVGVSGANRLSSGISASTRAQIAHEVRNPTFDVWTGTSDKTMRKMSINLSLAVTGKTRAALGGLHAAEIGLTLQYAGLNQPQTITAPTNVRPFSEFTSKAGSFEQALTAGLGGSTAAAGAGSSSGGGNGAAAGAGSSSSAASSAQKYSKCAQAAGSDVSKLQKCAPLLSEG